MSYVKTKGIVVKQNDVGDSDRVLNILTENGIVNVWARGARRPKSKLLASAQLFCLSDFVFYKSKSGYSINSSEVSESFFNLRTDIERLTYANYILELINDSIQEEQESSEVLKLLLNTLYYLCKPDRDPRLLTSIFELRLMCLIGFQPMIYECERCGREILDYDSCIYYDKNNSSIICGECINENEFFRKIPRGVYLSILHICGAPNEKLFSFNASEEVISGLRLFCREYVSNHMEKEYRSLDFLNKLL